jgi:hypothetical protein
MGDKDGDPRIKSGNDDEGGRTGRSVRFGRRVEPPVSFPAGAVAEGKGIHSHMLPMDPLPSLCSPGMTLVASSLSGQEIAGYRSGMIGR